MSLAAGIPLILLLILLEAFFSGSELALVSADRVAIRAQAEKGSRSMTALARFMEAPERILTTTLIGTNVCVVTSTTVLALLIRGVLGEDAGDGAVEAITVACLTPAVLLFGELLPKSLFRRYSARIAPVVIQPLTWLSVLLLPLVGMVRGLTTALLGLVGAEGKGAMDVSREELRLLLDRGQSATIEPGEVRMINRIFDFREITAKEVMRPLIDVIAVEAGASLESTVPLFQSSGFSRLPVYEERIDNIVGALHAMDLLSLDDLGVPVSALKRDVSYVPSSRKVELLLQDLQERRHGLAIVVDEYGGAEGLVTVEDILEEIVGEIEDEHDEPGPDIVRAGDNAWIVSARVEIDRLNEYLDLALPEGDYETLAGLVLEGLEHIPGPGEALEVGRARLIVEQAGPRAIETLRIEVLEPSEDEGPTTPQN